jgi:hypothetical protein
MSRQSTPSTVATIGIDLGKSTFHLAGLDQRGTIVLRLKTSRNQLERRLTNIPHCLIGMLWLTSYRPTTQGPWSRRTADPGTICEAVP